MKIDYVNLEAKKAELEKWLRDLDTECGEVRKDIQAIDRVLERFYKDAGPQELKPFTLDDYLTPTPGTAVRTEADMLPNLFGERLKRAMEANAMSQYDLAGRIGESQTTISCWQRGVRTPANQEETAKKLTGVFSDFGYQDYWINAIRRSEKLKSNVSGRISTYQQAGAKWQSQ